MMRALLASALLLAFASPGAGQETDRLQWKYQSVSWYSRFSLNATLGPVVLGKTAIFGGVYTYRNAKSSSLSAIDLTTGRSRWRVTRKGALGPLAVGSGAIVVAAGDDVLLLDPASGRQRWRSPVRVQTVAIAGDVALASAGDSLVALDLTTGKERWRVKAGPEPVVAGDTAFIEDGERVRALDTSSGKERWSLPLPLGPSYVHSLSGDRLYLLGPSALGSINVKNRAVEWTVPLESTLAAPMTVTDDTLYFTTRDPSASYVFRAFDPATQKDRWRYTLESHAPMAPVVFGPLVGTAAGAARESFVALSRDTGSLAWRASAGSVTVQPVLKDDVLYVAGQGPHRLYAFKADTGAVLWTARLGSWPMGMALTDDGTLLVSADNLALYAYRTRPFSPALFTGTSRALDRPLTLPSPPPGARESI
jgi:outer membrane protein assembly factor BamB